MIHKFMKRIQAESQRFVTPVGTRILYMLTKDIFLIGGATNRKITHQEELRKRILCSKTGNDLLAMKVREGWMINSLWFALYHLDKEPQAISFDKFTGKG